MQSEYRSSSEESADSAATAAAAAAMAPLAAAAAAVAAKEEHAAATAALPLQQQAPARQYRGVRMRKWGKWVAEIREPHKRTRIWLGSYATPVAAACAYDTAVFYLRGRSARLNFPEEISSLASLSEGGAGEPRDPDGGTLSAASIRKKAIEVGSRVDALQTGMMVAPPHHRERPKHQQHHHHHHPQLQPLGHGEEQQQHQKHQRTAWSGRAKNPDLNRAPSPESSDAE
ncbi:hypothetical protein ABZP36_003272 [Zizania latifolia]